MDSFINSVWPKGGPPQQQLRRAVAFWLASSPDIGLGPFSAQLPNIGHYIRLHHANLRTDLNKKLRIKDLLLSTDSHGVFCLVQADEKPASGEALVGRHAAARDSAAADSSHEQREISAAGVGATADTGIAAAGSAGKRDIVSLSAPALRGAALATTINCAFPGPAGAARARASAAHRLAAEGAVLGWERQAGGGGDAAGRLRLGLPLREFLGQPAATPAANTDLELLLHDPASRGVFTLTTECGEGPEPSPVNRADAGSSNFRLVFIDHQGEPSAAEEPYLALDTAALRTAAAAGLAYAIAAAWPGEDPLQRLQRAAAGLLAAAGPRPDGPHTRRCGVLGNMLAARDPEAWHALGGTDVPTRLVAVAGAASSGSDAGGGDDGGAGGGGGANGRGWLAGASRGGGCQGGGRYLQLHERPFGASYVRLDVDALVRHWPREECEAGSGGQLQQDATSRLSLELASLSSSDTQMTEPGAAVDATMAAGTAEEESPAQSEGTQRMPIAGSSLSAAPLARPAMPYSEGVTTGASGGVAAGPTPAAASETSADPRVCAALQAAWPGDDAESVLRRRAAMLLAVVEAGPEGPCSMLMARMTQKLREQEPEAAAALPGKRALSLVLQDATPSSASTLQPPPPAGEVGGGRSDGVSQSGGQGHDTRCCLRVVSGPVDKVVVLRIPALLLEPSEAASSSSSAVRAAGQSLSLPTQLPVVASGQSTGEGGQGLSPGPGCPETSFQDITAAIAAAWPGEEPLQRVTRAAAGLLAGAADGPMGPCSMKAGAFGAKLRTTDAEAWLALPGKLAIKLGAGGDGCIAFHRTDAEGCFVLNVDSLLHLLGRAPGADGNSRVGVSTTGSGSPAASRTELPQADGPDLAVRMRTPAGQHPESAPATSQQPPERHAVLHSAGQAVSELALTPKEVKVVGEECSSGQLLKPNGSAHRTAGQQEPRSVSALRTLLEQHRPPARQAARLEAALERRFPGRASSGPAGLQAAALRCVARLLAAAPPPAHELQFALLGCEVPTRLGLKKPRQKLRPLCEQHPEVFAVRIQGYSTCVVRLLDPELLRLAAEAHRHAPAARPSPTVPTTAGGPAQLELTTGSRAAGPSQQELQLAERFPLGPAAAATPAQAALAMAKRAAARLLMAGAGGTAREAGMPVSQLADRVLQAIGAWRDDLECSVDELLAEEPDVFEVTSTGSTARVQLVCPRLLEAAGRAQESPEQQQAAAPCHVQQDRSACGELPSGTAVTGSGATAAPAPPSQPEERAAAEELEAELWRLFPGLGLWHDSPAAREAAALRCTARLLAAAPPPARELALAALGAEVPQRLGGVRPGRGLRALCGEHPDVFALELRGKSHYVVRLVHPRLLALAAVAAEAPAVAVDPANGACGAAEPSGAGTANAPALQPAEAAQPSGGASGPAGARMGPADPPAQHAPAAGAPPMLAHAAAPAAQQARSGATAARPPAEMPAVHLCTAGAADAGQPSPTAGAREGRCYQGPIPLPVPVQVLVPEPAPVPTAPVHPAVLQLLQPPGPPPESAFEGGALHRVAPQPPPPPHQWQAGPAAPAPAPQPPGGVLPPAATVVVRDPYAPEFVAMLQHCHACPQLGLAVAAPGGTPAPTPALVAMYALPLAAGEDGGGGCAAAVYLLDCTAAAEGYGGGAGGEAAVGAMLGSVGELLAAPGITKVVHGGEQLLPLESACGAATAPLLDTQLLLDALLAMLPPLPPLPDWDALEVEVLRAGCTGAGPPAAEAAALRALHGHAGALRAALLAAGLWAGRPELLAALAGRRFGALRERLWAATGRDSSWLCRPLSSSHLAAAAGAARHLPELWAALAGEAVPWVAAYSSGAAMESRRAAVQAHTGG